MLGYLALEAQANISNVGLPKLTRCDIKNCSGVYFT